MALNSTLYHANIANSDPAQAAILLQKREIEEAGLHIGTLCDLHCITRQRFHRMERAYEIAHQYNLLSVICVSLRNLLLGPQVNLRRRPEIRAVMQAVVAALHRYCWESPSDANDTAIRTALLAFDTLIAQSKL
ncbi:MAG: hypothetical protein FD153_977 [Rhodospirillaceae bacterium]|nr:MAG: hypothetical protein FD153_977 [Rhodospirillaceae bacterium]